MNLNRKTWIYILLFYTIGFIGCTKDNNNTDPLIYLVALNNLSVADIVFEKGFPGSDNILTTNNFTGVAGDYTITIGGESATGINLPGDGSLEFIMPTVSGITENTTLRMVVTKNGNPLLSKTVRYRPIIDFTLGTPNSYIRPTSAADQNSYFSITLGSTGDVLFNIFGYFGANLNLYYYSSPTGSKTTIIENGKTGAQFKKANLASGTYIIEVKYSNGIIPASYRTNIANGQIQATSVSNWVSSALCYEKLGGGNTYVGPAHDCNGLNSGSMTRSGRCTYPSDQGITTRNYYISPPGGGPGFLTSYAEFTCTVPGNGSTNEADAIFEDN
ncbi:hypothetical protein [Leptospira andrefontaineae]|uniref:IPT/TIG domain-containing protein n=1 Tax=Leptospira andrefontaineae TaxID=2484976 RepID=A0A4R9H8R7_9LEPT|nr:hypothetical protein [Leptospira andrefontaineae]TGK42441.1 hypothetical protein EHO65_06695 [Leptospira andrefontaineae]